MELEEQDVVPDGPSGLAPISSEAPAGESLEPRMTSNAAACSQEENEAVLAPEHATNPDLAADRTTNELRGETGDEDAQGGLEGNTELTEEEDAGPVPMSADYDDLNSPDLQAGAAAVAALAAEAAAEAAAGRNFSQHDADGVDIHSLPILPASASRKELKKDLPLVCQIVGCGVSLVTQAEYYQRYRICRDHLRAGALVVDDIPQRFCQQCGRFHELKEFDGDKRNCRTRLAQHNSRRRKAGVPPGVTPYGSGRRTNSLQMHLQEDSFHDGDEAWMPPGFRRPGPADSLTAAMSVGDGGVRRSREVAFDESAAAVGRTLPPTLRSRPLEEPYTSAGLAAFRQQLFASRLGGGNSLPDVASQSAYLSIVREVEAILGRQLVQSLLQEAGLPLTPDPPMQPSSQAMDLLQTLMSGNRPGQPSLQAQRAPSVHQLQTFLSTPAGIGVGRFGGSLSSQLGNGGRGLPSSSAATDALRNLATTVPRAGFGPSAMAQLFAGASEGNQQAAAATAPMPVNPFMQHRDSLQQQLQQLTAAAMQAQAQAQAAKEAAAQAHAVVAQVQAAATQSGAPHQSIPRQSSTHSQPQAQPPVSQQQQQQQQLQQQQQQQQPVSVAVHASPVLQGSLLSGHAPGGGVGATDAGAALSAAMLGVNVPRSVSGHAHSPQPSVHVPPLQGQQALPEGAVPSWTGNQPSSFAAAWGEMRRQQQQQQQQALHQRQHGTQASDPGVQNLLDMLALASRQPSVVTDAPESVGHALPGQDTAAQSSLVALLQQAITAGTPRSDGGNVGRS